jgi:hypothetical protein
MSRDRALMLVRLRSRQPNGTVVGEADRVCHLVPVPDSPTMPEFLVAYCGLRIGPGAAEVLPSMAGMPCEPCLVRSPVPILTALRPPAGLGAGAGD